ncbi:SRPBCC family protein [Thermopolyspora sp. NPDC052614]|uniref:SRPBCC family protein n=1 Tax=Thermopolyspora sp. NPDC052614 TaxID=3155682 RepID=UPI0034315B96
MAMRFEHEFTVPVPVEQAWPVLLDVERVAPCLPGAAVDSVEGTDFTGRMKVKVGPITVTYNGKASFEDIDKDAHSVTMKAAGRESRGSGTANATVHARLLDEGGHTKVKVETSFNVTGRPAQFGRGVMAEVGGKLIDRFAENLAELLRGETAPAEAAAPEAVPAETAPAEAATAETATAGAAGTAQQGEAAAAPAAEAKTSEQRHLAAVPSERERPGAATRASRTAEEEALDLLEVAGAPVLKRVLPALGVLAAIGLVIWLIRRLAAK